VRYAENGLPLAIRAYMQVQDLRLDTQPSLEGQIAALADDIAYNNHDIDDGFRAGYIDVKELEEVPIAGRMLALVRARHGDLPDSPLVYEMNRRMIASMVQDVLAETEARIANAKPSTIEDIRRCGEPLARFSEKMAAEIADLRRFLFAKVYKNAAIVRKMTEAQRVLRELYDYFGEHPQDMNLETGRKAEIADPIAKQRAVGDFVAGMTDMFALKKHAALFGAAEGRQIRGT
jgi:dGTPase